MGMSRGVRNVRREKGKLGKMLEVIVTAKVPY